jgi:hypothetical protein
MYGVRRTLPNGRSSRKPPHKEPGLACPYRQAGQPSGQALKSWSRSQQTSILSSHLPHTKFRNSYGYVLCST